MLTSAWPHRIDLHCLASKRLGRCVPWPRLWLRAKRAIQRQSSASEGPPRARVCPQPARNGCATGAPRHAQSLKNCVCAVHEPPPRPLRLVPSTPTRTLTSYTAVRPGSQRPVYVSGLTRVGREHRSKREHACLPARFHPCAPGAVRPYPHASAHVPTGQN